MSNRIKAKYVELPEYRRRLIDAKATFTLSYTKTSGTLKVKGDPTTVFFTSNNIPLKYLNLIKKVKAHVDTLEIEKPYWFPDGRGYNNLLIKDRYRAINSPIGWEVDVSAFYTTQAYLLGYLNEDLLYELLSMPKKYKAVRQICLGALAKSTTTVKYVNGVQDGRADRETCERSASVFWHVCMSCDELCKRYEGPGVVCYWTDNFVTTESPESITEYFAGFGFDCKTTQLAGVLYDPLNYEVIMSYPNGARKSFLYAGKDGASGQKVSDADHAATLETIREIERRDRVRARREAAAKREARRAARAEPQRPN